MAGRKPCSQIIILPEVLHSISRAIPPSGRAAHTRQFWNGVARNTRLAGGPVGENLAGLLLLPFLLLLRVDFMTAIPTQAAGPARADGGRLPVARSENCRSTTIAVLV